MEFDNILNVAKFIIRAVGQDIFNINDIKDTINDHLLNAHFLCDEGDHYIQRIVIMWLLNQLVNKLSNEPQQR